MKDITPFDPLVTIILRALQRTTEAGQLCNLYHRHHRRPRRRQRPIESLKALIWSWQTWTWTWKWINHPTLIIPSGSQINTIVTPLRGLL